LATERPRLRVVFDTNVVVAALKSRSPHSPTNELLQHWQAGEFDLLYSADLRAEYEDKFTARAIDPLRSQAFLSRLEEFGIRVEVPNVDPVIEADPDDDIVTSGAVLPCFRCVDVRVFSSTHLTGIMHTPEIAEHRIVRRIASFRRPILRLA